jgi:hypothetical protein
VSCLVTKGLLNKDLLSPVVFVVVKYITCMGQFMIVAF